MEQKQSRRYLLVEPCFTGDSGYFTFFLKDKQTDVFISTYSAVKSLKLILLLDSPASEVLLPQRREVDPLQEPDQDAVALVELGVTFLADELREPGVAVQLNADQTLEVCVEQKRRGGSGGVRLVVHDVEGFLRPLDEGVTETAWRELPMAEPTDCSGQSTWRDTRWTMRSVF